ncbi:MAG: aminotransferase class IV [Sphingobacteriaceae bacterium]
MTRQFININHEIVPADLPVFTVANRGFRYGDGLFESMRMMNGKLKFAELHADRIQRGMKALKIDGYTQINAAFLQQKVEELSRRNKLGPDTRARLTVYRDAEGLYSPSNNRMGFVLETTAMHGNQYEFNSKGLLIDVFTEVAKPAGALSGFKTCNALVYVLAGVFKNQHKLDEVLVLNQDGFLCEGLTSNVFVVYDGQIYTPALQEGCIAGVMRHVLISLIKKSGLKLIEAQINPAILDEAEEIFVSNAAKGIQWVLGYNGKRYFNKVSRFLNQELNKL